MIKPQKEFPLLELYKETFPITTETIFAFDGNIYTNYSLPDHLIIHEKRHLFQQERDGLQVWVDNFLNNPQKRLEYELDSYGVQLKSIKDRELRNRVRLHSANMLSSPLYGNIITYDMALKLLK